MILNLTQHPATPEQLEAGVVDLPAAERSELCELLTFEELPSSEELDNRAEYLAQMVTCSEIFEDGAPMGTRVMIGGAPFFMEPLAQTLRAHGYIPVYAFSRRESVETDDGQGGVRKTAIFRHLGFVEAPGVESRPVKTPVGVFASARFGSQAGMARFCGVSPQQVTQWINDGWVVCDGALYAPVKGDFAVIGGKGFIKKRDLA